MIHSIKVECIDKDGIYYFTTDEIYSFPMKKTQVNIIKSSGEYYLQFFDYNNNKRIANSGSGVLYPEDVVDLFEQVIFRCLDEANLGVAYYKDKDGKHRFHVLGSNPTVLIASEPYASKQKAKQGFKAVQRNLRLGMIANGSSEDSSLYNYHTGDQEKFLEFVTGVHT